MRKSARFRGECSCPITAAQLLSTLLPDGLRLLRIPIPAPLSAHLTVCFPLQIARGRIRAYHVPRECPSGLGLAALPVARHLRQMSSKHLNLATYLLVQAYQHLWLVLSNGIYQRFTMC